MLFNSLEFLIFFPLVTLIYFLLPHKFRWIHLLVSSCVFYMSFIPEYIFILAITILIDYYAGIWIEKSEGRKRKRYLVLSVVSTCLVLVIFKYYNFFSENLEHLFRFAHLKYPGKKYDILLPIGLSFHTFQSLSYVFEVYRGNQRAEKHFGIYSLYVMFYPQLVTGPIERPQNLLVSLREKKYFTYDNVVNGLRLMLFGLFVKMVIADHLAQYVDQIYQQPAAYTSLSVFTGMVFYSFQIYCDFYGYSLIAVGCARVMGFHLMDNFKTPYLSLNINEFWQRWHISLSSWFRDYVYIPLGGRRVKYSKWIFNILLVFILSGFWHGANWTFILWGLLFAVIYLLEYAFNRVFHIDQKKEKTFIMRAFLVLKTFTLVTFCWVFFRSQNMGQIKNVFSALVNNLKRGESLHVLPQVWVFLGLFIFVDILLYNKRFDQWCSAKPAFLRWSFYLILIFCTIVFSSIQQYPFIYFQF